MVAPRIIDDLTQRDLVVSLPLLDRLAQHGSRGELGLAVTSEQNAQRISETELLKALSDSDLHLRHSVARLNAARGSSNAALGEALRQHDPLTASIIARVVIAGDDDDDRQLRLSPDPRFTVRVVGQREPRGTSCIPSSS